MTTGRSKSLLPAWSPRRGVRLWKHNNQGSLSHTALKRNRLDEGGDRRGLHRPLCTHTRMKFLPRRGALSGFFCNTTNVVVLYSTRNVIPEHSLHLRPRSNKESVPFRSASCASFFSAREEAYPGFLTAVLHLALDWAIYAISSRPLCWAWAPKSFLLCLWASICHIKSTVRGASLCELYPWRSVND